MGLRHPRIKTCICPGLYKGDIHEVRTTLIIPSLGICKRCYWFFKKIKKVTGRA